MISLKSRKDSSGLKLFFKAMVVTLSAVLLILIGYFTAGFFTGGI